MNKEKRNDKRKGFTIFAVGHAFTLAEVKSSRGTNEVRGELASTEAVAEPHLLTKIWLNLVDVGQQVFRCKSERCRLTRDAGGRAFTLAEVLIALGIIGIVAAMTIPSLMQNINNKQLTTATNNFNRRFGEALRVMNSQGTLAGHKTTENFVNELSKVFKVAKVCDNTKLDQCFSKNITWGEKEVDTTTLTKSLNIVDDNHDWGTDVMGVQFANGVSALLAYNPECKQDSGNNNLIQVGGNEESVSFSTNNCLAMLYDVSSNKKPNKVGTDIQQTSNVENLGEFIAKINGVRITQIVRAGSYDPINCQNPNIDDSEYCYGSTSWPDDYWAGVAKLCGGKDNMANDDDLLKIAQYLYNDSNIGLTSKAETALDSARTIELQGYGFPSRYNLYAWSSNVYSTGAYVRYFGASSTVKDSVHRKNSGINLAVCVKH